jgi:glyoxylase-like metal-dependent hydrolase (beta-lactamase superfamily II)
MKPTALAKWLLLFAAAARAQPAISTGPDPAKVQVKTTPVAGSVSLLQGDGGNIGVSVGDDGVFVIDDEYAPLAPKIKAALAALSKKPLRFVVNTHWHGDHTGGNEAMAANGALVVAHDNVRKRMSEEQTIEAFGGKKVPPAPAKALPAVTFSDEMTFHLNGDVVHVFHVAAAHTDSDALVHFEKANALVTGDVFIHGMYPVIDYSSGGTVDGYIAAQEKVLAMIGDDTKIIPGHGALGDKKDLQATHDMLVKARAAIGKLAAAKKTLEQVIAAKPTAEWDAQYGQAFIKPEMFVSMVYKSLPTGKSQRPSKAK